MTRTHLLFVFAILLAVPALAEQGARPAERYTPVAAFDPARDAARDIRKAVAEARRSGRRVLLDVGGEWCIWCRRLDTLFVQHKDLESYLHHAYVVVKVNWSPENKNEAVLSRYPKIPGYPHFFVLDSDGTLLRSQGTGELEAGKHHDPDKVMAFLRKWAPKQDGKR